MIIFIHIMKLLLVMPFSCAAVLQALKNKTTLILSLMALLASHVAISSPHWGYRDSKIPPSRWGKYFPACRPGGAQSPVNIKAKRFLSDDSQSILFDIKKSPLQNIVNNGHTIQVNFSKHLANVLIGSARYKVLQLHFHSPSENTVNGRHFPLVMHVVARNQQRPKQLAVIAIFFKLGRPNKALTTLWQYMPKVIKKPISLRTVKLNLYQLIPAQIDQDYRFIGSLTTPPCTHRIKWFVAKTPLSLSNRQLAAFNRLYQGNNRPIQQW
jgi:carbonic anhydrase